jgi:PAS domain S-box-containing protein
MIEKPIKILLIDSNPEDVFKIKESLSTSRTEQFECIHIDRLSDGLESLVYHVFDIILLDLSPPNDEGFALLTTLHQASPDIPAITMSRTQDDDLAARARREGAYDHLFKGAIDSDLLKHSVLAAVKHKQTENQLIHFPDAWARTFDAIPDLIMILDSEHRIIRANKAMAEKLGLYPEELIGRSCYHIVHETEEPPHFCPHARLMTDGLEHSVEVHEDHLGGDFLVSVTPMYNPDGTIRGSVHVARDITEIKHTEEELRGSEQELGVRNRILEIFLTIPDDEAYAEILKFILETFKSEYGTFGYFDNNGDFIIPSMTREIYWEKCSVPDKEIIFERGAFRGIWEKALKGRKSFYSNEGPFNIPQGHVLIKNTMVTPIIYRDEIISAIHIANKPTDYDEQDVRLLETIAHKIAPVIHARVERDRHERERKQTEEALQEKTKDLAERIKELNCLFEISKLREEAGDSLEETLKKMVSIIPPAWQYPEITCARLTLEDQEYKTNNFKETAWKQSSDIVVHARRIGSLEVSYTEKRQERDEGPFLKEERQLLNAISERIGRIIEHKRAVEDLKKAHDELEMRVQERTAALEAEHAFRQSIENSILSGIAVIDLEGRQTHVNPAFCKMVGWSAEELIGATPPFVYWATEHIDKTLEILQAAMKSEMPPEGVEIRLRRKSGERFDALLLVSPLKDRNDNVIGWVGSVGDITARKKAEEALRKSEARLAEAQRIASLGNWDWNIQTNELQWSDEIYRIFGLTPQEFGATYDAFLFAVHPDDREFVKRAVHEALYGLPYSIDHRIVLPDGTIRFVHEQGEVTFGESGEPIRMLGTVQDITERKESEKALQDSQANYAAIVEGFDGFVYIYSENHDIEFMNERMMKHIGYDATGQKCTQALQTIGDICPWCKDNIVLANETVRLEIHNRDDNRWYYIINTPIHNQDKSTSRMVMIQDITEKKENEARLIMSERLSALGQMASGIAHEINNPLATISACAEGLLNRIQRGRSDPEVFENYLNIIHEEVARCKNITTGMLSFVREKAYEKKHVHIDNILDKALELISFQGRLKKVEVVRNYKDSPVVHGSEGALKQVFLSIIMNALDAMEDKGTIMLETGIEDREAFIKICDSGPGISSEEASKIFDPFFTTKSEKGGIGLGLSIANKIIIDNDGKIQVVSEREKGTTFTITLPAVQSGNMSDE